MHLKLNLNINMLKHSEVTTWFIFMVCNGVVYLLTTAILPVILLG